MTRRSSDKRPEEIEEEIAQTRADMDSTLDAIQRKLSPPELLEQALAYVRENGGEKMMKSVGSMVRDNPIPVALIGAGMAWFMYSAARRRNGGMYEEEYDRGPQAGLGQGAYGTAYAPTDRASHHNDGRGRIGGYARERWERARDDYGSMVTRNPLLIGAAAFAAGAALGLSVPATRREDEALGAYRDEFLEQAQSAGREEVGKVQRVAEEAWQAAKGTAKDAASREGLSGDGAARSDERSPAGSPQAATGAPTPVE